MFSVCFYKGSGTNFLKYTLLLGHSPSESCWIKSAIHPVLFGWFLTNRLLRTYLPPCSPQMLSFLAELYLTFPILTARFSLAPTYALPSRWFTWICSYCFFFLPCYGLPLPIDCRLPSVQLWRLQLCDILLFMRISGFLKNIFNSLLHLLLPPTQQIVNMIDGVNHSNLWLTHSRKET